MPTPDFLTGTDGIEPQDIIPVWSRRNRDTRAVSFGEFGDAIRVIAVDAVASETDGAVAAVQAAGAAGVSALNSAASEAIAPIAASASQATQAAATATGASANAIQARDAAAVSAQTATAAAVEAAATLAGTVKKAEIALSSGASTIGSTFPGTSTPRSVQSKLNDQLSIRDKGAVVDGIADDTAAIAAARSSVATTGGSILFGGKTYASGFFENLSPLAQEWIGGAPGVYLTSMVPTKPVTSHKLFNGTPQAGGGFAAYAHRLDTYTQANVDVASTVGLASVVNSLSNNSGGSSTTNNTNQVAILASAAAQSTTASAPVTGINAIATSAYAGATWQPVVGVESDIAVTNPPGFFGQASKSTGIAYSAVLSGSSVENATAAYAADTSKAAKGFLYGAYLAGIVNAGVVVARNTVTPDSGVYVSAAKTYGIYVGAKQLYDLGPGKNPTYDTDHNPAVAIALGQTAAVNGRSGFLRFVQTDGAGAELTTDIYRDGTALQIAMNGAVRMTISSTGAILNNGLQVVAARQTGFTPMTGTSDKTTAFDTSTVTVSQLASRVLALEAALRNHGLIGL